MRGFEVRHTKDLKRPKSDFLKGPKKGKIHPPKQGSKKGSQIAENAHKQGLLGGSSAGAYRTIASQIEGFLGNRRRL
jgi:hypothetical protein